LLKSSPIDKIGLQGFYVRSFETLTEDGATDTHYGVSRWGLNIDPDSGDQSG